MTDLLQAGFSFPVPLTEKYRPRTIADFAGLALPVEFSSYGIQAEAADVVKESNGNVRESLMKLELELMLV